MDNNNVSISLCMIVKNEEEMLGRPLKSASSFVDEIIIVDTGSTDKTKEIAKEFNAKIYDFKWINDFSAARNFAFSKATKDYVFWLDADDYIDEENVSKINELKSYLPKDVDSFTMNYSLSRDDNGNTTFSLRRNRLVKRKNNFKWIGRIHEYLAVYGKQLNTDITINHGKIKAHTDRNLKIFREMQKNNEEFSTRDLFYFANELYYNGLYNEAIIKYEEFLDLKEGWIEDRKTATMNLINCYSYENQNEKKINRILKSFEYDVPRADICCALAETFMEKREFHQAIFWYKIALGCRHDKDNLGMDVKDYYTWIPSIQLCVCYCGIKDYEAAYYYNEITALYIPESPKIKHNRDYLKNQFKELGKDIPKFEVGINDIRYKNL